MAQKYRLPEGGRVNREQPLRFSFDGKTYEGFEGDTLASALIANGVRLVGRSFKYHRPRGIITSGVDEPNALVDLASGTDKHEADARTTMVELVDGMDARSINNYPSLSFDVGAVNSIFSKFFVSGFYYKTFMWPKAAWLKLYEPFIRKAAGLGHAPTKPDSDHYEKHYGYCDVLIIGAGPAGLAAARVAARSKARVWLVDDQSEFGGHLLTRGQTIDGMDSDAWIAQVRAELEAAPNVTIKTRAQAISYFDMNYVAIWEKVTNHMANPPASMPRERLYRVRAGQVIIATGSHERPLVFADNDRPGAMLAGAAETYVKRYGVKPGKRAVAMVNNDYAYGSILALLDAGIEVPMVCDLREEPDGALTQAVKDRGVPIKAGYAVVGVKGAKSVSGVKIAKLSADGKSMAEGEKPIHQSCDLLVHSAGWTPAVHAHCMARGKLAWSNDMSCFLPAEGSDANPNVSAGNCVGQMDLASALQGGHAAALQVLDALGMPADGAPAASKAEPEAPSTSRILWIVPGEKALGHGKAKHFIDFQNDSTAFDLQLAVREGMHSIEHVKRYTTTGMATDQGKLANLNAIGIVSEALGVEPQKVGTTTYRLPYTPTTFGVIAGRDIDTLLDPARQTAMHPWHVDNGAVFEDVGQWKRPWYFPKKGESMHKAVLRESAALREHVGILDASTLGKIVVKGPDAGAFLDLVYTNKFSSLKPGKCRYGLMLNEDGMILDDGVTSRISEDEFYMTTTTGNAAPVLDHLEEYLQTEWPHMQVYLTSVTEQWATATIAGPKARDLLAEICPDVDLSNEAFGFMEWREGTVADCPARIFRISFTGDVSFEINVPSDYGLHLWTTLMQVGRKYNITPYGTETMHVLRAEKGFIIVGQETDGSVMPFDLDMNWIVSKKKGDFIGRRSLYRADMSKPDRKQLVGIKTVDPSVVLEEGAQLVRELKDKPPMDMVGHVTSSYESPACGRSIALGIVKGGLAAIGETLYSPQPDGKVIELQTCSPVFFDPEGTRQNG